MNEAHISTDLFSLISRLLRSVPINLLGRLCFRFLIFLFSLFKAEIKIFAGLQSILLRCWLGLSLLPCPVRHYHAMRALWCANTATISYEKLLAWFKVSSIRVFTCRTWLIVSIMQMVAVWHYACFLIPSFDVLEQVWASSINGELFKFWSFFIPTLIFLLLFIRLLLFSIFLSCFLIFSFSWFLCLFLICFFILLSCIQNF